MRLACALLLILPGCTSELPSGNAGATVSSLVLTPDVATVDTGSTLQFVQQLAWTDGGSHTVAVAYTATGGTISATGLYQAGTTPGTFVVIASCACALADTATVTIKPPAASPSFAGLTVTVAGLPIGALAQVVVNGPNSFTRTMTTATTIDSLTPGEYQVRASEIMIEATSYEPSASSQGIILVAGREDTLRVEYQRVGATGLPAHPRVWMTAERITRLQAQVAAGTTRWLRVKAGADAQVAKGGAFAPGDQNLLPDLCLAYLGTKDARYAQRAGAVLLQYAVETNDLKYDSGYGVRFLLPLVTMGLDWCYGGLTVAQRQQAATWLMNRADWTWPESTPSRAGNWGTSNPSNNYWWGFMMTGPAALAALGDDTGSGLVSGADRPTFHRDLALRKWNTIAVPYFNGAGKGGAWSEGTNYDSSWRVGRFVDAFQTAGNAAVSTPFIEASLRWRIASTMPGNQYKVPISAQPRTSDASLYSYDRTAALFAVASTPGMAGQVKTWLDAIGQVPQNEFNETAILAEELLLYDPAIVAEPINQPKDHWAEGPGFFIYHNSWSDPAATVFAFESGPVGARDENGLMIWKGAFWISATANIYSNSGLEMETRNYNTMTVGAPTGQAPYYGPGQYLHDGNGGVMQAPVVTDALVVLRGQAKGAYGYANVPWVDTRFVDDYLRTVAYLPVEDAFVIVDRASIKDATKQKTWRWHTRHQAAVTATGFVLASPSGDARCVGSVLNPGDVMIGIESFALGQAVGAISSYAVTVTLPARTSDVVVTVLQCAAGNPWTPTATVSSSEVTVTLGGRLVIIPLNEAQAVRIQ